MSTASSKGKLYLLPSMLGNAEASILPDYSITPIRPIRFFIAEKAKTARHFLKKLNLDHTLQELVITEHNKRNEGDLQADLLQPIFEGYDMALVSEAGCPGVADPGAKVVRLAHDLNIQVVPLIGPSSILLALMASGMNGQCFAFHGYLSPKRPILAQDLRKLEKRSQNLKETELFMETPYRNTQLLEVALATLNPNTLFGVAANITTPDEWIKTKQIKEWKREGFPNLHKTPAMFMLLVE